MGDALLHGDVPAAFGFNPLALVGLVILGVLGVVWTVEAVGGRCLSACRGRFPNACAGYSPMQWLVIGLLVADLHRRAEPALNHAGPVPAAPLVKVVTSNTTESIKSCS